MGFYIIPYECYNKSYVCCNPCCYNPSPNAVGSDRFHLGSGQIPGDATIHHHRGTALQGTARKAQDVASKDRRWRQTGADHRKCWKVWLVNLWWIRKTNKYVALLRLLWSIILLFNLLKVWLCQQSARKRSEQWQKREMNGWTYLFVTTKKMN